MEDKEYELKCLMWELKKGGVQVGRKAEEGMGAKAE